jgi:hypothetical protein
MWLRELLPDLIPTARIRTFSYSSTANDAADVLHPETLALTSKALLRAILSARKEVRLLPTLPTLPFPLKTNVTRITGSVC